MNGIISESLQSEPSHLFPFRFLLRWDWPCHIQRELRLTIWSWLKELSREPDLQITDSDYLGTNLCLMIAAYPDAPGAVLDVLADLQCVAVQERVAENRNTWPSTLNRLAHHRSELVRIALADNLHVDEETIARLLEDASVDVRYALAGNPERSGAVLNALAMDKNVYVAACAGRTLAKLSPPPVAAFSLERAPLPRGGEFRTSQATGRI
ncbi:MAG: hypothetical protein HY986_15160 [Candidatus Melainabacteria bacterium]|nr:hypothetical protein [Candidatus Melainabacteria bacterium]